MRTQLNFLIGPLPTPSSREKVPAELATGIAKVATKIQSKRMPRKDKVLKVMTNDDDYRFFSLLYGVL